MAQLDKLQIHGIRNFGADAGDEQKIVFSSPLTLILGANGCGKTTIIECIKYALTGELPPNCKDGRGFINNAELSNLSEVMGQVKLRIKTKNGGFVTVSRSAKVIKKNEKYSFKTLDSTITLEIDGREENAAKRINDATEDMCTAFGVSKAIINDVMFCHQEEASWPMGTDQELMAKFDKIFGTTDYNNAMDRIRQMQKQYDGEIKDKEASLKMLEMLKDEADRHCLAIHRYQDDKIKLDEDIKDCNEKAKPITAELKQIEEIEKRISNITKNRAKVEAELTNAQTNVNRLQTKIVEPFLGTIEELQQNIDALSEQHMVMTAEKAEELTKLQMAKHEEASIGKQIDEKNRKYHTLVEQRTQEQDLYAKRAIQIKELCAALNIVLDFDVSNDNHRANSIIPRIKAAMDAEKERIAEIAANNNRIDAAQEQEIVKMKKDDARINSEIQSLQKEIAKMTMDENKQKAEKATAEESRKKLQDNARQITQIKGALESILSNTNTQDEQEEILRKREERDRLNIELESLDEQIQDLSSMAQILATVAEKEKLIEKKGSEIRRIKNKHAEHLKKLFDNETIESNFKQKIESLNQHLRTDINRLEAEMKRRESNLNSLKMNRQNLKQQLSDAEVERNKLEAEIDFVCESEPFQDIFERTKEEQAKLQMEHSSFKSSESFYKKYIRNVTNQPCCPLCHKDLNQDEAGDLKTELENEITQLPQQINRSGKELNDINEKLENLRILQPKVERFEQLRTELIPNYKAEVDKISKELAAAQEKIVQVDKSIREPKEKQELVSIMIGDMSVLDDNIKEFDRYTKEVNTLKSSVLVDQGDVSLDTLKQNRKDKSEQRKQLDHEITSKEKQMNEDLMNINRLRTKEMDLKRKEMELQNDVNKIGEIQKRLDELDKQIDEARKKKKENEEALQPIQIKIREAENQRRATKLNNQNKYDKENERFDKIKQTNASVENSTTELKEMAARNLEAQINRLNGEIQAHRHAKEEKANLIRTIDENITDYTNRIADHEKIERNLEDNFDLKTQQAIVEQKQKELNLIKRDEREVDSDQLALKRAERERDRSNLYRKIAEFEGSKKEIDKSIANLQKDLQMPKYRDATRNYKSAFYHSYVTKKLVDDLGVYYEILEKSLTEYHRTKMAKINRLVRELWRDIYKGNDIDYIQILTEEIKGTTKRRNYTYRVVASKNDAFMDFRGQSSAGQRVLACLIIRIALAETFSKECGVLALDEPTTNLDRVNIESLCHALNKLVEEREDRGNFMLIVITHDHEFIDAMDQISSYWKVSRDENGKSKTEKLRVR